MTAGGPVQALEDAVARTGGSLVADEPTAAGRIADLEPGALVRVARAPERTAQSIHTT